MTTDNEDRQPPKQITPGAGQPHAFEMFHRKGVAARMRAGITGTVNEIMTQPFSSNRGDTIIGDEIPKQDGGLSR